MVIINLLKDNLFKALLMTLVLMGFILYNIFDSFKDRERYYNQFIKETGSFKIDSIYMDLDFHSDVVEDCNKNRILYESEDLVIQPMLGDSIYKPKGIYEYVIIKKDSTYVQSWKWETKEAFIIDKWKNGEKKYAPSTKSIPQPNDLINSTFIK